MFSALQNTWTQKVQKKKRAISKIAGMVTNILLGLHSTPVGEKKNVLFTKLN